MSRICVGISILSKTIPGMSSTNHNQLGHNDVSIMNDKDIFKAASSIVEDKSVDPEEEKRIPQLFGNIAAGLMKARQSSLQDQEVGKTSAKNTGSLAASLGQKVRGSIASSKTLSTIGKSVLGSGASGGLRAGLQGLLTSGGGAAAASTAGAGGLAAGAGGLAAAAGGPVGIAVALAPAIIELGMAAVADTERRVLGEGIATSEARRTKISAEVTSLLSTVQALDTEENLASQQRIARDLLTRVSRPDSFAFSTMQGLGLQKQLEALGTSFGPTNMVALKPYESDAELVAGMSLNRFITFVMLIYLYSRN
jgi:hypothetical protein